ncbi:MAG TPA: hypothetical protein VIV11_31995, partial [Kofleriaceae bacterium]
MHRVALIVCAAAATAHADDRIDLVHAPEVRLLEPVFPLDRHISHARRTKTGTTGSLALGLDHHGEATGVATLGLGQYTENVIAAMRSELAGGADGLVRGRHRALVELRSDWDDELVGALAVKAGIDHGLARGLAAPRLGVGPHSDGNAAADGMVRIGSDKGDFHWVAIARADAGATRWLDAPGLDRATRKAISLGTGQTSFDGELPRGSVDLLRGRVEHTRIQRPFAPAGAGSLDTIVRAVELGIGMHDFTLHIDHELLAVIAVDLGWTWLEANTAGGTLRDNAFRMRLGAGIEWIDGRAGWPRRTIGFGLGRTPTHTPDGQRLVSEWRIEGEQRIETEHFVLGTRGGITWLTPIAGASAKTLLGYGVQLDAALKLGHGIEAGVYSATTYQP